MCEWLHYVTWFQTNNEIIVLKKQQEEFLISWKHKTYENTKSLRATNYGELGINRELTGV